jgi:hypothetical protein
MAVNPCAPVAKYDAKEGRVVATPQDAQQTWALPALGLFAMFSLVAGVGATVYRRSGRTHTHQVSLMEDSDEDGSQRADAELLVE